MRSTSFLLLLAAAALAEPLPSRHYYSASGPLTAPTAKAPEEVAQEFARAAAIEQNLAAEDLPSIRLVRRYRTWHSGVTHFVFAQQYAGVDAKLSSFVVNVDRDGQVINAGGTFYPSPAAAAPTAQSLSRSVRAAMQWADPGARPDYLPPEVQGRAGLRRFQRTDGFGSIDARAVWYPVNGRLEPAWEFFLNDAGNARHAAVVHSGSHEILATAPLTFYQEPPPPRGLVFPGTSPTPNPRPGFPMAEEPPYAQRLLLPFTGDPVASPAGWVEGTETEGNNVIAGRNPLGTRFLVEPVTAKSPTRDFQFPLQLGPGAPNPTNYTDAAIVNLFYWMNRAHDLFWHVGFDEAAGNYQKRNFGRGGVEGDPIYAYTQFGVQQVSAPAGFLNAFYTTQGLEDGSPAMIAMFLGAGGGVFTDSSFDTEVMIHEYTHGVSLRLVRDLAGHHGGAMGEAWSDFFALEFTTPEGAPPDGVYTTGDYFFQRLNVGIRTRPYSTRMDINPVTFGSIGRVSALPAIHQDAGIWVQALMEMRANLIRQFGETEGRRRTRLLVIDGMKLSVPSPTMVDARDAILLADRTGFRGESQAQIWQAFAKRGLGVTAYAPSSNSVRVLESLREPTGTASVAFSQDSYVFGEAARVVVHDPTLTGDVALVQLTSYEAGQDVQTIRLRRRGNAFSGTVPTSSFAPAVPEDGVLAVVPGSVISVYYNDPDAAGGARLLEASAAIVPNYSRTSRASAFRATGDQPLGFRTGPNVSTPFDLPWEFPFYGRGYSSVRLYNNGLLSFDVPPESFCQDTAALRPHAAIAPLWGNFRTNGTAQPNEDVYISRPSPDAITFRWVAETNPQPGTGVAPAPVNFSATLYQDGRIEFHYGSGNQNLVFPAASVTACTASPVIGLSRGTESALTLVGEYLGRPNLENAPTILFEPPYGPSSVPEIDIEVPNAADEYAGILQSRIVVSDANSRVADVFVFIDNVLRGRAAVTGPPGTACQGKPNCSVFSFPASLADLRIEPGTHTLKVRAMNARGGMSETEVTFRTVAGQSGVPVVRIESPEQNAEVRGTLTIRGYAAAPGLRIIGLDVLIDGVSFGRAQYGIARNDVCPQLGFTSPNCPNAGFTFSVNTAASGIPLGDGEHLLEIRVQDETGRLTTFPETPLTFRVNNGPNQPPTGVLATPVNGERVSGTILIWGYAWDPDGRITQVQLLVDGVPRAVVRYGDTRPGECASLPDVAACPNIGFWHEFNTKTVLNGPHVLGIRLIDDRGRAVIIPQAAANGLTVIVQN